MSKRLNHEKANRKQITKAIQSEAIRDYRLYGNKYASDEQLRYLKHLYDIIEEKGIKNDHLPKFKMYRKSDMRRIIKGAITTLKKHGYDTHGNYLNTKEGFLRFMEDKNGKRL